MAANSITTILHTFAGEPQLKRALNRLFGSVTTLKRYYTVTLSPAFVAPTTCAEQLFTVTGVKVGDVVNVNKPTAQAGLAIGGSRASAANQIGITFINPTAGAIVPTASEVYKVEVYTPTDFTV